LAVRRNVSLKELKENCKTSRQYLGKNISVLQFTTLFHRPTSIYFTKLFLMAGISPDAVTMISYVFAVAAGILFIFGNYWYALIGIALYQLFIILDDCDGDMSRYMYGVNKNPRGGFLEDMGHSIIQPFIIICIAFGVYNNPQSLLVGGLFHQKTIILILGFIGSNLYLALHVFDYYSKSRPAGTVSDEVTAAPVKKHGPLQYSFAAVSRFRGVVNKYHFSDWLLLITAVSNTLWLFLILWSIIYLPLIIVNGVISYQRLAKPKVLEQETEPEKQGSI